MSLPHRDKWQKHAQKLDEARSKAIETDHSGSGHEPIISPYFTMPSNRLVNFGMLHAAQSTIKTTLLPFGQYHTAGLVICPMSGQ